MSNRVQVLKCEKCGGEMRKSREATKTGIGLFFLLIGFVLLFLFPIGTIFGFVFLIVGIYYGSKSRYIWVCKNCGYKFERKGNFWSFRP